MTSDFSAQYDALRHWYLARLRSLAIKRASHLTPATLMKADREVVERLMSESAVRQTHEDSMWQEVAKLRSSFTIAIWVMVAFSGILFLLLFENKIAGAMLIVFLAIFAGGMIMVSNLILTKLAQTICQSLGEVAGPSANADPIGWLRGAINMSVQKERAIVDYAPEIVCCLNEAGEVLAVNSTCDYYWGIPSYKLIGKKLVDHITAEEDDALPKALQAARNGGHGSFECTVNFRGTVVMSFTVEWSKTNQLFYLVGKDVTIERELDRVKREHIAMVSHDLRSPLTSIYGQIVLLTEGARGEVSEKMMGGLQSIKQNSTRLINLVNDILEIEKLESGQLELQSEWHQASKVASEAINSVSAVAEQKKVGLEFNPSDIKIYGDSNRLVQVLVNLLSNAIRFSPEGSKVTITAEQSRDGVKVTVKDQGPGIAEKDRQVIFERFKQVGKQTGGRGNSGLGLTICRGLIEKHRGTLGVDSEVGSGSSFWFWLPNPWAQSSD